MEIERLWELAQRELLRRKDGDLHTQQVVEYVREMLVEGEGGDEAIAIPAAMLHDIGIPAALERYGSAAGPYQEREGEAIARRLLTEVGCPEALRGAICDIVAHHHQRLTSPAPEFRLVWDADALMNSDFSDPSRRDEVLALFYTTSGREIARRKFERG